MENPTKGSAYRLRHKYWRGPIQTKIMKIGENQLKFRSKFSNFSEDLKKKRLN
jgi:hypothetical protein